MDLCVAYGIVFELEILFVSRLMEIYEVFDFGNDFGVCYVLDIVVFVVDVCVGCVDVFCMFGFFRFVFDDRNAFGSRGVVCDFVCVFCGCYVC